MSAKVDPPGLGAIISPGARTTFTSGYGFGADSHIPLPLIRASDIKQYPIDIGAHLRKL